MIANNIALSENLSTTESMKEPNGLTVLFLLASDPSSASKRENIKKRQDPTIQYLKYINTEARIVPINAIMVKWMAEKLCLINKSTKGVAIFSNGPLSLCIILFSLKNKEVEFQFNEVVLKSILLNIYNKAKAFSRQVNVLVYCIKH